DYSIQKLLEKELIVISGRDEQLPGRPLVYATSQNFMDYFGINSSDDLPQIKEVLADLIVEPTIVTGQNQETVIQVDETAATENTAESSDAGSAE
ncbi:MAG: SMC-Scp complex subunit ScpB, partial [Chitinophagaceae bacterium]|nr:SMC-Scp complex subunit ScpB [Chitinophagaceae bacterium]